MAILTGDEPRKLSAIAVRNKKPEKKTTRLSDGYGLFLEVRPNGGKYWRYHYRFAGRQKTFSIGVYPGVSLAKAREIHRKAYNLVDQGIDPSVRREELKEEKREEVARTFSLVATEWYEQKIGGKRSETHQKRTLGLLGNHINPYIGDQPISHLDKRQVSGVLKRMETAGILSSAHKARQIIQQVIRFASASGYIDTAFRIEISDGLEDAISPLGRTIQHYNAPTTPGELAPVLRTIDASESSLTVKTAMQLTPILFVRPKELVGLQWLEISWPDAIWTIPASRMKAGREHTVPLPKQAIALFQVLYKVTGNGKYAFPSLRSKARHISAESIRVGMRTAGISAEQATPHGFRATARTMLAQEKELMFRIDIIEHQLAHAVRDATGTAYNRTTFIEERKEMMQAWADYLDGLKSGGKVVPFINKQA